MRTKVIKLLNQNSAFTLIELMVSVCIIAIAFAGLATMQVACIHGNAIANNLTTGITLAQDMMEQLRGLDYNDPTLADVNVANNTNLDDPDSYDYRQEGIDAEGETGGMYTRICNVADDTPIKGRKTVVVIVTWQGHTVRVSSIIGPPFS